MKKGKKYSDSVKLIDRTKLYDPEEAIALVKQTAKRPLRSPFVWALTPVTLTSRSAAPSFCPMVPARRSPFSLSPRATRLPRLRLQALSTLVLRT